jgi:hypothetical protein
MDLMSTYEGDRMIPVRNLDDGSIIEWRTKDSFESIGTAIFFACLQQVMEMSPDDLRKVYLTIVKEPSKARSVTKGHAALKIVLDTVSKIVSWPLKKGFRSSESGMGKAHHGWNLFKDFFSDEMESMLFTEDRALREEDVFADHLERLIVWEDIFAGSTDYSEATDRMIHAFSQLVGIKWMRKCGIPQLLIGIVCSVCYQPRKVYFTGTGPLSKYGEPAPEEGPGVRYVVLRRGVLMGDPLTKVVLHFTNIVSRELASTIVDGSIFAGFQNGNQAYSAYLDIVQASSTEDVQDVRLRLGLMS